MTGVDRLKVLLSETVGVLDELATQLEPLVEKAISARVAHAFLVKTVRTLGAIAILYKEGLEEQAQALVRVVLESWLSFGCFSVMARRDEREACIRFLDCMMLEKVKQARASKFAGLEMIPGGPTQATLEADEAEIKSRYSSDDLERMKKNGFTGIVRRQAKW